MRHLYNKLRLFRSLRTKMLLAGALLLASSADGQTICSFRQENRSLICHTDSGTLRPAARCRADDGTTASAGNRREGADGHTEHVAACATVRLTWDDARRTLTLHPRQGSFEGMRTERPIRLILHDKGQQPVTRPVTYDGRTVMVSW